MTCRSWISALWNTFCRWSSAAIHPASTFRQTLQKFQLHLSLLTTSLQSIQACILQQCFNQCWPVVNSTALLRLQDSLIKTMCSSIQFKAWQTLRQCWSSLVPWIFSMQQNCLSLMSLHALGLPCIPSKLYSVDLNV